MESSNTELNRTTSSPVLKHEHDSIPSENFKKYSSEKIPTPSSSTKPSSADDHPYHNDDGDSDDDDNSTSSSTPSSPLHKPEPADSSPPVNEAAATEAPPNQEMERSPSAYRIPLSVFERSQSSTPLDWSIASNESLFSIHTGNMSFTNDQYFWRSGDLGPPTEASTSDQMFSYSAHDSGGGAAADMMRSHELGLAEATMLEVIKESEGQSNNEKSLAEERNARRSEGSNTSNKSFAFSIMGGEIGSSKRVPSSVRSNQEQAQSQPTVQPEPEPDPKAPTETGNEAQSSWFSCFSCCTSR